MAEHLSNASLPETSADIQPVQTVLRFLRAVRYRKAVVIVSLVACGLLGGLYYATVQRSYQSNASLLILQTGANNWNADMTDGRRSQDLMGTYGGMLRSEVVMQAAVDHLSPEHQADFAGVPKAKWVDVLSRNLSVSEVRKATIFNISYCSKDPLASVAMVESLLTAYQAYIDDLHKSTSVELLDILTKEKVDIEKDLDRKNAELLRLRNHGEMLGIKGGDSQLNVVVQRAVSLNDNLIKARDERLQAQSRLAVVESALRQGQNMQECVLAMVDTVGREVMMRQLGLKTSDPYATSRVQTQLIQNQAELQAALRLYGPSNRKVLELEEQIRLANHYLQNYQLQEAEQARQISENMLGPMLHSIAQQQLEQAVVLENTIFANYQLAKEEASQFDHTLAELEIVERDVARLQAFYEVVQQRLTDINLGQENGLIRTSVLARPKVPLGPVWPNLPMVGLLSIFMGLAVGLGIVYVQDLLDDHFRSPEELRMKLGIPVLSMVGKLSPVADVGVDAIHVHVQPNAAETEAFRTLRTALAMNEGGSQRIVVSSSEPGDGKTTVITNLATAYAQSGKRTLLIDADMRRPGLTPLLNLKGQKGLSSILRDALPVAQSAENNLCASLLENLDVIPSGPRPINPTELLTGERFSDLLAWAETRYDQILVDSPPALVSDTAIIGRLVDGVLLTVQPQKNRRRTVIRAAESFPNLGINVLGIVINRVVSDDSDDYYGYGYGYGYGYSYGHDDELAGDQTGAGDQTDDVLIDQLDQPAEIVRRAA
ncbi:MAG TPA: polysaccharide biosynthesis tyrosine autokinase [Thermoguttaceae bacterium]|nr:polysaccharide biosynthesis tyrosine autokinase [Thermoguttaceae bacterium]